MALPLANSLPPSLLPPGVQLRWLFFRAGRLLPAAQVRSEVNESVQPNLVMFNVLLASTGRSRAELTAGLSMRDPLADSWPPNIHQSGLFASRVSDGGLTLC